MTLKSLLRTPLAAAALGMASIAVPAGALLLYNDAPRADVPSAASPSAASPSAEALPTVTGLPDFRALVKRYGPAVVNISVRGTTRTGSEGHGGPGPGLEPDDPLFQFFRGMPMPGPQQPTRGEGSGFIVDAGGVILTNAHVVNGAQKIVVKLSDRREYEAKLVGLDENSDVAVLKIEAQGLPTVRLGDPARTEVGEWVVAIGAPFGLENTVTAGIVSAKSRNLPDESYVPFIQTDVAVNPGNSGGPLFNLRGEVVGINSQIYSRSGGYQGISFAIPIDVAMNVSRQLQAGGHVSRGRLGVGIQELDQALARSFGLETPRGALVSTVENDGPAAGAGVEAGDVILSFDGKPVASAAELPALVSATAPGRKVELEIWRASASRKLKVELGEVASEQRVAALDSASPTGRLGLTLRPLSPDEQRAADVPQGMLVERVDGVALEAGIRRGDILLSADGVPLRTLEDLRKATLAERGGVALLVQRGTGRLFVPVEIG